MGFDASNSKSITKDPCHNVSPPAYLSSSAQSLLKALLTREASKRLGHGAQGSADIKAHPFFKAINWTALEQRRVPSPFKPTLKCIDSVENFDKVRGKLGVYPCVEMLQDER